MDRKKLPEFGDYIVRPVGWLDGVWELSRVGSDMVYRPLGQFTSAWDAFQEAELIQEQANRWADIWVREDGQLVVWEGEGR